MRTGEGRVYWEQFCAEQQRERRLLERLMGPHAVEFMGDSCRYLMAFENGTIDTNDVLKRLSARLDMDPADSQARAQLFNLLRTILAWRHYPMQLLWVMGGSA